MRDLFTEALELWRSEKDPQSDGLWRLVTDAAGHGRQAYDIGLHFIKSPDAGQRVVATDILAMVAVQHPASGQSVAKAMVDLLSREEDQDVLWSALVALGPTGSHLGIDTLTRFAKHDNADLRCQAVQAITLVMEEAGTIDPGLDSLVIAMDDTDNDVKYWATTSISETLDSDSEPIREALSRRLFDTNDDIRNEAIFGLAKRKDPRMTTTLEQALLSKRPSARVFDAVEAYGDKALLPALRKANSEAISDERFEQIEASLGGDGDPTWPSAS